MRGLQGLWVSRWISIGGFPFQLSTMCGRFLLCYRRLAVSFSQLAQFKSRGTLGVLLWAVLMQQQQNQRLLNDGSTWKIKGQDFSFYLCAYCQKDRKKKATQTQRIQILFCVCVSVLDCAVFEWGCVSISVYTHCGCCVHCQTQPATKLIAC